MINKYIQFRKAWLLGVFLIAPSAFGFSCDALFFQARRFENLSPATQARLIEEIEATLRSDDPSKRLEAEVAEALGQRVIAFRKQIQHKGRTIGEIDVETSDFIIEVKSGPPSLNHLSQLQRMRDNRVINPYGKPVIVFTAGSVNPDVLRIFQRKRILIITHVEELFT